LKNWLLILYIIPLFCTAQFYEFEKENYFFISTGVDIRNAVYGGTVNSRALDIVFGIGARTGNFQVEAWYESFTRIEYEAFGMNLNYVFQPEKRWVPMVGLELGFIQRPRQLHPSLALIAQLDYNFSSFFVFLRGQGKLRTDLEHLLKGSVYGGLGYKF
jgi:hypothetical protein